MTEMERRVADAIARHIDMSGIVPLEAARAAIKAMYDPPYDPLVVAGKAADQAQDEKYRDSDVMPLRSERVLAIWHGMIDAALLQETDRTHGEQPHHGS